MNIVCHSSFRKAEVMYFLAPASHWIGIEGAARRCQSSAPPNSVEEVKVIMLAEPKGGSVELCIIAPAGCGLAILAAIEAYCESYDIKVL